MTQVNNKDIDNASGQVVRLDIQNTIKAVTTNNFGARNDAGTILPCEFLADDTTNKLLIRKSSGGDQANPNPSSGTAATFFTVGDLDQDNLGLLPRAGGTNAPMTGQFLASNSSNSFSPAISFAGNEDLGIFRSNSNAMGFCVFGIPQMVIDSTGITLKEAATLVIESNNSKSISIKSPNGLSNNVTFTLPDGDGSAGEVLKTDGDEKTIELVEVDGPKLMKQQSFYDQCIEQAGVWIPAIPRVKFDRMMKEKFDNRERSEDYDEDAGESSKFIKTFIEYLKYKKVSNDRLALIRNEPVIEQEEDILDFSIDDFESYLNGQNIKYNKRGRLVEHLKKRLKAKKVKGKKPGHNNKSKVFWRIKNFSKQYEIPTGTLMLEGEIVDEET